MPANTTTKVASITGAAKDDLFLTSVNEDALSANLNVLANDPGSAKLYALPNSAPTLAVSATMQPSTTGYSALGATLTINADGTIHYDGSTLSASLQSLAAGEAATDTFTYVIRMANGALSTATATVQVGGVNDAPTLLAVAAANIEDTAGDDAPAAISGALAGSDVDHHAALTYHLLDGASAYGTLSFNADGTYAFSADADLIDSLGAGVNVTASYTVDVTDEFGAAAAPVTLSFNLLGANDTASIAGDADGAVGEDGTLAAVGTLTVSDRDAGEASFQTPASLAGTYGDFTFDANSGAWTYALRNGDANVQALSSGDLVSDSLTVASLDGSASQTISVSIAGADEPVVLPPNNPHSTEETVTRYMVTNGTTNINARNYFTGFDANDQLVYASNLHLNSTSVIDTDNDGVADATDVLFTFKGDHIDVILVGFTDLQAAQIVVA